MSSCAQLAACNGGRIRESARTAAWVWSVVFDSGTGKHMESVREQGHAGAHFALPLAARWLKTIEFDQTFLISLKESVTSGTHPHEVVQFETIAVGPSPVVQLQRARKKVGFTGRLKYSSFGQTRVFT